MPNEFHRQLIHISGILFVILAQFIPQPTVVVTFFLIAVVFFIYAELIQREKNRFLKAIRTIEQPVRSLALSMERRNTRPFLGATLFYLGAALAFLFPLPLASAAVTILAIGDGFATLIGSRFGSHTLIASKSVEGTAAFILTALPAAAIIVPLPLAVAGAVVAAAVEAIVAHPWLKAYQRYGLDDNLVIPLAAAVLMSLIQV